MFSTTWTVYLVLILVTLHQCLSAPPGDKESAPKTLREALVEKCPSLVGTNLSSTFNDIIDKKCANWAEINSTSLLTEDNKNNAQCLVFYESLLAFCTRLGDQVGNILGVISYEPSTITLTEETVCGNGSHSLYSLKNTEHNISGILKSDQLMTNCIILCVEIKQGKPIIRDICKYSYYLAEFDTTKFRNHLNQSLSKPLVASTTQTPVKQAGESEVGLQKPKEIVQSKQNSSKMNEDKPKVVHSSLDETPKLEIKQLPPAPVKDISGKIDDKQNDADAEPEKKPKDNNDKLEEVQQNKGPEPEIPPVISQEGPVDMGVDKGAADAPDEGGFGQDDDDLGLEDANVDKAILPSKIYQKSPVKQVKPNTVEEEPVSKFTTPEEDMDGDSYFFSYFTVFMCLFIAGYVGYHNRQKILALLLEGKRGRRAGRQGRRPNSANYHKLDSNLEEAISSTCTKNASNVIY